METLAPVILVVLAGVILVIAFRRFQRVRRGRRAMRDETVGHELQRLAEQHGWDYESESVGLPDRFVGDPFLRGATGRPAYDVLTGTYRGRSFCCFQYVHTTRRSGEDRHGRRTSYYWVFAVGTSAPAPTLQVTKEHANTKLQRLFGKGGFRVGDEQFDNTFRVSTDDEQFTREVLNVSTMQWMLLDPRAQQLPFRFERDELLTWQRQGGRFDPASVTPTLDYLGDVLDRVPSDAWR